MVKEDGWEFFETEQEIIDKMGQEYMDKIKRIVKAQEDDKRTDEEKRQDAVNFIMYGPGGD